ncbi:HD-GYP domain-containing protein [Hallerella porci]|uniref:Energy-coupling factor transport system substrate-specific component n=1 Tax=Hallerella porci TaxID=1945871 RepID=A0ABX5LNY5_9BACT|nr:HD domain-containing phosphohydrolase [Hallerella porci]PWL01168.1 energy-coupling factor transport system substrate-specific component [Hallerella porci]
MGNLVIKRYLGLCGLIAFGLIFNRIFAELTLHFHLPLYLDSIGTIFVAALGGFCPGAIVGFLTNFIGGIVDSSTFYYGTINFLIAVCTGIAARFGAFESIRRLPILLLFLMILSIPGSLFSYFLYHFEIAENVVSPITQDLHSRGLPIVLAQILADYLTEVPDKTISVLVAYTLYQLTPKKIFHFFDMSSGRIILGNPKFHSGKESLRHQVSVFLAFACLASVFVATAVGYKIFTETKQQEFTLLSHSVNHLISDAIQKTDSASVEKYIAELEEKYPQIAAVTWNRPPMENSSVVCDEGAFTVCTRFSSEAIQSEVILFCTKIFSTLSGLLLCIVFAAILFANQRVVYPIQEITAEMENFEYDSKVGRKKSIASICALPMQTGNEIENLHKSIIKAVEEIDHYITKSKEQSDLIAALQMNIITTLSNLVETRDETTGGHVQRTANYAKIIARQLQKDGVEKEIDDKFVDTIYVAAPLHDIGKIRVSDMILNKPGKLTVEEFDQMKLHSVFGRDMLAAASKNLGDSDYLQMAKEIAYSHHEWWDGSRGYPEKLKGKEIPLSARIMAVADVFDALVSVRPYKNAFSLNEAMKIIAGESGTHFDPDVVNAFLKNRPLIERMLKRS